MLSLICKERITGDDGFTEGATKAKTVRLKTTNDARQLHQTVRFIVHEDKLSPRSVLGNFGSASIPFKKKITDQDKRSDIIESQMYVIKKTVHEKLNTRAHPCVEDMEEAFDDCVEKHIERRIYCTIPWKKYAGDNG